MTGDKVMIELKQELGTAVHLDTDFDSAVQEVVEALKQEGFGVLTEIDVQATFKKKLDVEYRPTRILGACNPALAYRALQAAPQVGLLLPCNVLVSADDDGTAVSLVDPMAMLGVLADPALEPIAAEARQRLERVAASLRED
jgi:uncharacterized protein (DUF302 family)